MSNPTSNFNWQMPTATDLVTDLPADFEVFGQAVDTSLADLKGGTTGQVLKKNTNADMDFVWAADSAGMTNPMTTTGDIIYSSSGSTPARLGIGTSGQVIGIAAGVPAWTTPAASGGMTLLETITFNGVASYTSATIAGTYKDIYMVVRDYKPATDGAKLKMQVNGITSNSYAHVAAFTQTSAFVQSSAEITNDADNTADNGIGIIEIFDYANTSTIKMIESKMFVFDKTTPTSTNFRFNFCPVNTTSAITTVTFFAETGNTTSGSVLIYGVN